MNPRVRGVVISTACVAVLGALVMLVWSAIVTSSAQVSASTAAQSFLSAGTINLDNPTSSQQLLFDTTDLYPGQVVEGCVVLDYRGSIPGTVRLFAAPVTSTGLDRFIELEIEVSRSASGCADTESGDSLFSGGLDRFWRTHDSYGSGLLVGRDVESDTRIALSARATLADDNDAQGRTIDFAMFVEVRP